MSSMGSNGTAPKLIDHEAERAVVASVLIDRDAIIPLAAKLVPGDFTDPQLKAIYGAMIDLYQRRIPADLVTIQHELSDAEITMMLQHLYSEHYTSVHAEHYADIVRELSQLRELANVGNRIAEQAYDGDATPAELSATAADAIARVQETSEYRMYASSQELAEHAYDRYQQGAEPVIETGFPDIDNWITGFKPGQLVIPAARPSVGKSAFQLQCFYQQAKRGHRVGMISLEMSRDELFDRLVGMHSGVNMSAFRSSAHVPDGVEERVMTAVGQLGDWPFWIDSHSSGSISDVVARARLMHTTQQVEALYLDYLQLVESNGKENRTQEVSHISRALKRLARQLNIPVIAASQLSRASEHREPVLSDLRESGSIEQDADVVMFIHRPDLHDDQAPENVAKIIIAKQRNGPTGIAQLLWRPAVASFGSYAGAVKS